MFTKPTVFPGEIEKPCILVLVDDTEHEEEEELRLVLGSPKSDSPFGASVGRQNETIIKIKDDADSKSCVVSRWVHSVLVIIEMLLFFSLCKSS